MIVANTDITISGRLLKIARVTNERYDFLHDPVGFLPAFRAAKARAHLLTFLQEAHEVEPKYPYFHEPDSIAILPISTYEHWLKKQINDKTRNMIRKASKCGVQMRQVELDKNFIEGVRELYNESPVRQGKRFWHYGLDFNGIKAHLDTFTARSYFVGAFHGEELIGFYKLTRNQNSASVMQIISKVAHRDKAPNNALLARAVEMCAELGIPYLQYGIWSAGGLGEYKIRHGFIRFDIPRYYIPLNPVGRLALRWKLYRKPSQLIPAPLKDRLLAMRANWYASKYQKSQPASSP
jgi:hypothetical protein